MIEGRMRKARRLLGVQQDLQRLEEERIAALRRRQAEIASKEEEIVGALSADSPLQGFYASVTSKKLKSLSEETLRLDKEVERRSQTLRTLATRTKYAERLVRGYEQQHARAVAEKELTDIIERALRIDDDASLP